MEEEVDENGEILVVVETVPVDILFNEGSLGAPVVKVVLLHLEAGCLQLTRPVGQEPSFHEVLGILLSLQHQKGDTFVRMLTAELLLFQFDDVALAVILELLNQFDLFFEGILATTSAAELLKVASKPLLGIDLLLFELLFLGLRFLVTAELVDPVVLHSVLLFLLLNARVNLHRETKLLGYQHGVFFTLHQLQTDFVNKLFILTTLMPIGLVQDSLTRLFKHELLDEPVEFNLRLEILPGLSDSILGVDVWHDPEVHELLSIGSIKDLLDSLGGLAGVHISRNASDHDALLMELVEQSVVTLLDVSLAPH